MKLKYIINDDASHYVMVEINPATKNASIRYFRNNNLQQERTMSIADVIDTEPTKNPQVQVAKFGHIWDLHVFKIDINGLETRRTVSLTTPVEVVSTKLEMINDSATDVTLKDYITHPLDVYASRLTALEHTFSNTTGLTGTSGNTSTAPVVTPEGYLELGNLSSVTATLGSAIDMNNENFALVLDVISLGLNDITTEYQLEVKLGSAGSNAIRFDVNKGVLFVVGGNENAVLPANVWVDRINMLLEVKNGVAKLYVNGSSADLPGFIAAETLDAIVLSSMCNDTETTRVNYLLVQRMRG